MGFHHIFFFSQKTNWKSLSIVCFSVAFLQFLSSIYFTVFTLCHWANKKKHTKKRQFAMVWGGWNAKWKWLLEIEYHWPRKNTRNCSFVFHCANFLSNSNNKKREENNKHRTESIISRWPKRFIFYIFYSFSQILLSCSPIRSVFV